MKTLRALFDKGNEDMKIIITEDQIESIELDPQTGRLKKVILK